METRERRPDEHPHPTIPATAPAPGADASLREAAEQLLARGADAIERALSQDSAAFLAANRQEGGQ